MSHMMAVVRSLPRSLCPDTPTIRIVVVEQIWTFHSHTMLSDCAFILLCSWNSDREEESNGNGLKRAKLTEWNAIGSSSWSQMEQVKV